MKRIAALFLCLVLLSGCNGQEPVDSALKLRDKVLTAQNTSFDCLITADYSDRIYSFRMNCSFDSTGNMVFSVIEPETISGISGSVDGKGGKITFDDKVLLFDVLADGYISPVSAPWMFMKVLRSGYINGCSEHENSYKIMVDDSYGEKPLTVEIWTDKDYIPLRAELLWEGRRVLSIDVMNFSCL